MYSLNDNLEAQAISLYKKTLLACEEGQIIDGKVADIGEFVRGKNITASEMISGSISVISAGLLPSGTHNQSNVKGPSITISGSGVNAGYVSFHLNDIWAADCSYNNNSKFIYCLYVILKDAQARITELQKGTAQPHVYPNEINSFEVSFPTDDILYGLETSLRTIFTNINNNNNEIAKLNELKEAMLSIISSH